MEKKNLNPSINKQFLSFAKDNNASIGQAMKVLDETKSAILNEITV